MKCLSVIWAYLNTILAVCLLSKSSAPFDSHFDPRPPFQQHLQTTRQCFTCLSLAAQTTSPFAVCLLTALSILIAASSSSARSCLSSGSNTARSMAMGRPLCLPLSMTAQRMSLLNLCHEPENEYALSGTPTLMPTILHWLARFHRVRDESLITNLYHSQIPLRK